MGYDISGFIADQRLTNDDIDQMFDGVEAEGITKFEGVTAGVVDVIRTDTYTLGLGVLEDIGTATLNSGEFIRFTIGSTAGVYIIERFVDGEKTDERIDMEGYIQETGDAFADAGDDMWQYIEDYVEKRTGLTAEIWQTMECERFSL